MLCLLAACGSTVTNVGNAGAAGDSGLDSPGQAEGGTGDSSSGDAAAPAVVPAGAKRIFITAQKFRGNLFANGGLAGADAACSAAAQAAGLGGAGWKAWLSSSTVNAIDRVSDVGPWYDHAGDVIFSDKAGLATDPLASL